MAILIDCQVAYIDCEDLEDSAHPDCIHEDQKRRYYSCSPLRESEIREKLARKIRTSWAKVGDDLGQSWP